jgi:hypothetical protein
LKHSGDLSPLRLDPGKQIERAKRSIAIQKDEDQICGLCVKMHRKKHPHSPDQLTP